MASDTITARWVGPYDAEIAQGILVKPGDEVEVTEADLASAHWQAVSRPAKAAEKEAQEALAAQANLAEAEPSPDLPTDEPTETD